ncbi:endo-1,4-beta-xylanase [Jannaschia sp. R86511]|uniref:endo-1,4-beta-xylanase n=1 Tax=Jannaschia sp. R86511 TaxID=3093853 RepID=UPI0036D27C03
MPRNHPRRAPWGAGLLALLLAGGAASALPAAAAEDDTSTADPVVVVSTDFSDDSFAPWTASGGPGLQVVEVDGNKALRVSNRANDYDGIQTPTGLLQPGAEHTFSMRARLAPGTTGSAGVRFVVTPTYTWVGNTTMTADAWTTVTGTFTPPAGSDPATMGVYLGTGALTGPYDYLVDDIVITRAGEGDGPWEPTPDPDFVPGGAVDPVQAQVSTARGTGDVAALTVDDGPNPGETDDLLDLLAERDVTATFCVIGQNVTAPGGAELLRRIVAEGHTVCNHGTTYTDMGAFSQAQVESDLKANLAIIREAAGDPELPVPYFRAPNGSWGVTAEVAVALGMQPLGLGNVIFDWDGNDLSEATLTANLRTAFTPGAVVLVHDGGGDRSNTVKAVRTVLDERLAAGWQLTLPRGGAEPTPPPPAGGVVLETGFEDGLDGWGPRADGDGPPTVAVTDAVAQSGTYSALVSNRTSQGDGIGRDVSDLLRTGTSYTISAWVRLGAGAPPADVWLSMQRTTGSTQSFDTIGQFTGIRSDGWTQVTATYQAPASDAKFLYFETAYPSGSSADLLVDDIVITAQVAPEIQDLTPVKDTVDFPLGVAIDSRETTGAASELLQRHFNQVSAENAMKPEGWYDADRNFRISAEATTLMDYAVANDLDMYGHVLVWHSQTPAWFFQNADGTPLGTSEADKQVLRDRMRTHIFDVAEALSTGGGYGEFGSDTNPVTAFDVVNEVVSDGRAEADGLRRSEWYRVLGEEFIDLSFRYADEAFNGEFAAEGSDRPVTLFINDYNTEQAGKQGRYRALVERLLARDVPIDGVGHQFHVSLAMPVANLEAALARFADLPLLQAVTELDVTTGTPVTEALLVEQGYYYRDAFRAFRAYSEDLFSVTVWGLTDNRSWRAANGDPLLFDSGLQAKPAYFGAVDGDLPARQRSAFVFRGDVPVAAGATDALAWSQLPLNDVDGVAAFQLRWESDHLTAYVEVEDPDVEAGDSVELVVGEQSWTVARDGSGDADAVVTQTDGGWSAVVRLPVAGLAEGDQVQFDLRATDGEETVGWNLAGALGTLTLVEPLSYTEVPETAVTPEIDGEVDAAWAAADVITTDKQIEGTGGATAEVRTLWQGTTLYVLAEVADPVLDASGSDPWIQDSVEIFLDAGNVRSGPYRYDDTQIRISYENAVSFGTGDEAFQVNRLRSETSVVDGGYVVEAAISLLDSSGVGTFHGFDVQVNDASNGARTSIRSWADPTGQGYQTTSRWGVAQLVGTAFEPDPVVTAARTVRAGAPMAVELTGYLPGSTVTVQLQGRRDVVVVTTDVTVGADGTASVDLALPRTADRGRHTVVATAGEVTASTDVVVAGPTVPIRVPGGARG